MNIKVSVSTMKEMVKAVKAKNNDKLSERFHWQNDNSSYDLHLDRLEEAQISWLINACEASPNEGEQAAVRKIKAFIEIGQSKDTKKVGRLEPLVTLLTAYIKATPHKWVFTDLGDGQLVPYFVERITYHPPDPRREVAASATLKLLAMSRGDRIERSIFWGTGDLSPAKSASEALGMRGFLIETPDLFTAWEGEIARLHELQDLTGSVFTAVGKCLSLGRYDRSGRLMVRDGIPSKVVMDDNGEKDGDDEYHERSEDSNSAHLGFWEKGEDDEEGSGAALPEHSHVQVFDLENHEYVKIHSEFLTPYAWQKGLSERLILKDEIKEIIAILVEGAEAVMEDIIAGKTGGVIVMATGGPGIGKTLTAEVYSEEIRRALYKVQCSQLGTDEEELEKRLTLVLQRASRWGAILLIDEADVYIRERGEDIQQNAIVGVFLRILEYHRGIVFMTSNRATVIDDAIMSRVTAHVEYELPTTDDLHKLWKTLGKQVRLKDDPAFIATLVEAFPGISGRNVKHLLKLSNMVASKYGADIDLKTLKRVSKYVDLASKKKAEK